MCSFPGSREFSFNTLPTEDWTQVWLQVRSRTFMVFAVTACQNVKIRLAAIAYKEDLYNSYVVTIDSGGVATLIE